MSDTPKHGVVNPPDGWRLVGIDCNSDDVGALLRFARSEDDGGERYIYLGAMLDSRRGDTCMWRVTSNKHRSFKFRAVADASRDVLKSVVRQRIAESKKRAAARGIEFDIDLDYIWAMIERANYKCAMTGAEFSASESTSKNRLMLPSIDRIDCSRGYSKDNVRVVLSGVNLMRLDMSDDDFIGLCKMVSNAHVEAP